MAQKTRRRRVLYALCLHPGVEHDQAVKFGDGLGKLSARCLHPGVEHCVFDEFPHMENDCTLFVSNKELSTLRTDKQLGVGVAVSSLSPIGS